MNLSDLLHALLSFLLLLEELALAGDVTAITFGKDVLPQLSYRFTGDDLATDSGLYRDLEHLLRDNLLEFLGKLLALEMG